MLLSSPPAVARDLGVTGFDRAVHFDRLWRRHPVRIVFAPLHSTLWCGARNPGGARRNACHAGNRSGRIYHGGGIERGVMGVAYGATAPASTHLLVPQSPRAHINLVLSLRQIGVPLAGMLAGLVMPPLTLQWGWRPALIAQMVPVLVLGAALEVVRRSWDRPHTIGFTATDRVVCAASIVCRQACAAATVLCVFRLFGFAVVLHRFHDNATDNGCRHGSSASRPCAGYLPNCRHCCASRLGLACRPCARRTLVACAAGTIMCGVSLLAARFGPEWPGWLVILVCAFAGATASGFTGIAYGEYARLGGDRRTEATGLGAASMFGGVMVLPALMSLAVTASGSYLVAYSAIGALALVSGASLVFPPVRPSR